MKVRAEHKEAFAKADSPHFQIAAEQHLKQEFPKHSRFLGEPGVTEAVHYARTQAAKYNLTAAGHAMLFLDLTMLLGLSFDHDPQLPWANAALSEAGVPENEKAQKLYQRAMNYLELVSGPGNQYIDRAQTRLLSETLVVDAAPLIFMGELKKRLKRVFPEKALYLGEDGLEGLIRNAATVAGRYGLASPPGVSLFAGIMFMLGSGFATDPLFSSWVASALAGQQSASPAARIEALHAGGIGYLKQWCA